MRNMFHHLDILLRNDSRTRRVVVTALNDIRRTQSLTERLETQMHTIYRQPLVLSTKYE